MAAIDEAQRKAEGGRLVGTFRLTFTECEATGGHARCRS